MENKNLIIILLIIVVVLATAVGILFFQSLDVKEPTKVKITSNKTQYEGGELSIQLIDLNKTPISEEKVNITITNKKDKVVVNKTVTTNSKGKAKLDLDLKKGEYGVNVTYGGNKNHTGNNTTQKLTIEEKVTEAQPAQQSTQSSSSSGYRYNINNLPPSNDPYPETSREQLNDHLVMQKYDDGYISYVDLRTGKRSSGGYYK